MPLRDLDIYIYIYIYSERVQHHGPAKIAGTRGTNWMQKTLGRKKRGPPECDTPRGISPYVPWVRAPSKEPLGTSVPPSMDLPQSFRLLCIHQLSARGHTPPMKTADKCIWPENHVQVEVDCPGLYIRSWLAAM